MPYTPPSGAGNVTTGTANSGATLTTNKPSNLADGDLLLLVGYKQTNGTYTTPSGFTLLYKATAASTRGLAVYAKPITSASGEASTYSIVTSESSSRWGMVALRFPGMASTYLDAAPSSDTYVVTTGTLTDPSVTAVAASTLALAFNFSNNSSLIYQTFTSTGWTNLVNQQITSGSSTSVVDVEYKEFTSAGSIGATTFTMSPNAASAGGFQLTLALAPTGTNYTPSASDNAGATDSASKVIGFDPGAADSAGGSDAVSKLQGLSRSQDDPGGATDAVSRQADLVRAAADSAGATDSCSVSLSTPATVSNNAEGGAAAGGNGTVATTANTGGGSGTALFAVSNLTFSSSAPPYGSYCYHGAGTTGVLEFGQLRLTSAYSSYSVHVNFRYNGTPSTEGIWFNPMDDTNATLARVHITAGNQLKVVNALGAPTWTSGTSTIPYTMVPGTDYTLQIASTVNATTGTFNVQLKPKASATVLGSATMVGNTGSTSFQRFVFGKFTSGVVVAGGHDMDEITVIGGSTTFIDDPVAAVNLTPSEAIGATDVGARALDALRLASEPVGAADAVSSVLDRTQAAAESLSASDVLALVREFVVDDAAAATDTDGPQELAWSDSYDDAASITDATIQAAAVTAADSATATDVGDDVLDSVRAAADQAGATDSSSRILDSVRAAADNAAASDTTALATDFTRTAADAVNGTDVGSRTLDALRDLADSASATDASASVEDFPRTPAETLDATDAASTVAASTRTASDFAAAFDSIDVSLQSSTGQTLNDNGFGSDVVDWTMDRIQTVDDFLNAVDAAQRAADTILTATDAASGADAASYAWDYVRAAADQTSTTDDAATGNRNYVASRDEPVGGVDRADIEYGRQPAETAAAADTLTLERGPLVDDFAVIEDDILTEADSHAAADDVAGATDRVVARLIPLYDQVESRAIHATLSDDSNLIARLRS